jgi:hypothetical protein
MHHTIHFQIFKLLLLFTTFLLRKQQPAQCLVELLHSYLSILSRRAAGPCPLTTVHAETGNSSHVSTGTLERESPNFLVPQKKKKSKPDFRMLVSLTTVMKILILVIL